MPLGRTSVDGAALDAFVALVGPRVWMTRLADIARRAAAGPRAGKAILQRHAIELAIARLRRSDREPSSAEQRVAELAGEAVRTR